MASALPLILAAGAAAVLLGKKKKKAAAGNGNVFHTGSAKQLEDLAKKQMGSRGVGIGVANTSQSAAIKSAFKKVAAQNKDLIFVIGTGPLVPTEVKQSGNTAIIVAGSIGGDGVILQEDMSMVKTAEQLRAQLGRFIALARSQMPKVLSPGASGAKAGTTKWKERQKTVKKLGYDPGKVDGKYGPKTKKAVMEFQSDAKITVDGKWGPQTGAAALQALKMVLEGLGKAAYGQIGKMLAKFKGIFEGIFKREQKQEATTPAPKPPVDDRRYLNPNSWPAGGFVTPEGMVRDASWLPDNLAIEFPNRKGSAWDRGTMGVTFFENKNYGKKEYLVKVTTPTATVSKGLVQNEDEWIRHFFKTMTSLRNLSTMYPHVNFVLSSVRTHRQSPQRIKIEFGEDGLWHNLSEGAEVAAIGIDRLTPTPNLVGLIANMIEEHF